jgi:hypothetical protein
MDGGLQGPLVHRVTVHFVQIFRENNRKPINRFPPVRICVGIRICVGLPYSRITVLTLTGNSVGFILRGHNFFPAQL